MGQGIWIHGYLGFKFLFPHAVTQKSWEKWLRNEIYGMKGKFWYNGCHGIECYWVIKLNSPFVIIMIQQWFKLKIKNKNWWVYSSSSLEFCKNELEAIIMKPKNPLLMEKSRTT